MAADPRRLLAFLGAGALAYTFFFSLVQSAWHFSFERISGTLEALFLTPSSRIALVLANGATALVQNAWLVGSFAAVAAFATGLLNVAQSPRSLSSRSSCPPWPGAHSSIAC